MSTTRVLIAAAALALLACPALSDKAAPLSALARMPVKEITIFKDGHVFAMHQGKMPTDGAGNVLMDYLPTPVLGAFWPFSADKDAKLSAVVASQRKVLVERTSLSVRELIEGNIGAQAVITEVPVGRETRPMSYPATIVGVPVRSSKELEDTSVPNSPEMLPQKGNVVLLKTDEGTKVVPFERIQEVTFKDVPKGKSANEEFRNLLTLKLDWPSGKAEKTADVGLFYLQRGLRWIPSYKVTIDGKGGAVVKLQATLINELTDLEDVTANLVIGVPTFAFADQIDPMALQQTLAQLSRYFRPDSSGSQYLSNTMMSQVASQRNYVEPGDRAAAPAADLGPEIAGSQGSEDLFIFTVKHITLKKGQRMVIPVQEFTLTYKNVYTLDIPFTPPPEVWRQLGSNQQNELARLMAKPTVMHKIRLSNKSGFPLTTAPALIIRDNQVLAQGMMTYTAKGAEADLAITTAVDVSLKKTDKETERVPNAVQWQGNQYMRVDLAGVLKLTNYRTEAIDLEVTRYVLGNVGQADHDGKVSMVNVFEDGQYAPGGTTPYWWGWYNWPYWWNHFNGVGKIEWKLKVEPSTDVELKYTWNYYWR
jgi:hypothetical protein